MKVLFIMNGVTFGASGQPAVSGGDVILIEVARRWLSKGVDVHFMTSSAGKELCERSGLRVTFHLSCNSSIPSIINYASLALKAGRQSLSLVGERFDLVYSSCEHVYDVFPALMLKRRNVRWAAMIHFVPPAPWTRVKAGGLNAILYYLNHLCGASIIRFAADVAFAVSDRTSQDYVHKMKFDKKKVVSVPGGISYGLIRSIVGSNCSYGHKFDGVFMKRLQPMKGAFDILQIWRYVVNVFPKAKLLIIGDGPSEVVARMRSLIKELGIVDNVELSGPVFEMDEKISMLASSKLFLLPSYEENWALVVGEALASGLPVLVYDLPEIRDVWKDNVFWLPKGDVKEFAAKTIDLLSNYQLCLPRVAKGVEFVKQFDWDIIADNQLKLCQKLI
jgi:glycosyltransferase involved in cell wall biosynthesis